MRRPGPRRPSSSSVLIGLGACRTAPPRRPRLVLLYATCTLNRDLIAPYGKDVRYTPNLAAFARESVVFTRHQTETDQSGPAFASLFSGTQVDRHGVFRHPALLPDSLYLAAEAFAAQGYETHFWSGHPMASADLNYGQGVPPENVHRRRPGAADLYALTANDAEFAGILDRLRRDPSSALTSRSPSRSPTVPTRRWTRGPWRTSAASTRGNGPASGTTRSPVGPLLRRPLPAIQWDYPRVVRELGQSQSDAARLADVAEAYYKVSLRMLDHCFGRLVDTIRAAGLLEDSLIAFTADPGETL